MNRRANEHGYVLIVTPSDGGYYDLYRRDNESAEYVRIATNLRWGTEFKDYHVLEGRSYEYRIQSIITTRDGCTIHAITRAGGTIK